MFLTSNRKITLCGCDRVEKYGDTEIELKMCDMNVKIEGRGLSVYTFVNGEISVTGEINALSLIKRSKKSRAE